jgi:peptidoglycan/LPS O-acetylase OafA/YrhL
MSKLIRHNPAIDAIRGLAIVSVMLLHLYIHIPFINHLPYALFNIIFKSGYYGVIIFFVISGFLITHSIVNKWGNLQAVNLFSFYRMRFARIIPCLVALVALLSILHVMEFKGFHIHTVSLGQALFAALTFHINVLEAKTWYLPGPWDVLWSLSVEEVFYIVFPLLCLLIKNERLFMVILCLFIVAGPFARTLGSNAMWQDHSYLSCMDGIVFGILAALLSRRISAKNNKIFLWSGLALFVLIFCCRHFVYTLGISSLGLNVSLLEVSIALLLIGLHQNTYQFKKLTVLGWYGRNSYEIYLSHMLIITLFMSIDLPVWALYTIGLIGSGWLGAWVARYYSQPLNRKIRSN